jgi:hypothetical protein
MTHHEYPMQHTLGSAAKLTGKSKSTLLRAIKSGRLSGSQDTNGNYQIETSELLRVFPLPQGGTLDDAPRNPQWSDVERAELEGLRALAEERQRTIDDLRRRLDQEGEERRKLMAVLTDQRDKPKGFWGRLINGR